MKRRGGWIWLGVSLAAALIPSVDGRIAHGAEQLAATANPLGDPREVDSSLDISIIPRDAIAPEPRTAYLDPTSENRDLFTPERLPPIDSEANDSTCGPDASKLPPGAKPGVLQQVLLSETFLAGGNSPNSFGMNDVALRATFGLPFPTIQSPLLITPGYTMEFLDGPQALDVPPRLYEAYIDFRWLRRLTPKLGMDLAVQPGVFSDFNRVGSSSIRIQGRGLAAYDWSERLRIVAGVLYLDRDDIRILPAAGLIWTPNDKARIELVFPRPRFARRLRSTEAAAWWGYVVGELGGNSYGVTRADGSDDTLTYRDFRVMLGLERKVKLGLNAYFESGYVFGRELEYLSGPASISPPGTVLVRGGLVY